MARRFLYHETAASFCGALALMLDQGIGAPEAISLAADVPANRALGKRLAKVAERVEEGANMAECFRTETALLPVVRWRLWSAYYRSQLVPELLSIAETSREQMAATEFRIVNSSRLLGGVVAAISIFPIAVVIVAMYLPLFTLFSQIG
jgi:type II secretory pathway component PulF